MSDSNEPDIERTAYLHEAGHAIVAIEGGLIVNKAVCDGAVCFCDGQLSADATDKLRRLMPAEGVKSVEEFRAVVVAYFAELVTSLGGIAGESLVLGRPIYLSCSESDLTDTVGVIEAQQTCLVVATTAKKSPGRPLKDLRSQSVRKANRTSVS